MMIVKNTAPKQNTSQTSKNHSIKGFTKILSVNDMKPEEDWLRISTFKF